MGLLALHGPLGISALIVACVGTVVAATVAAMAWLEARDAPWRWHTAARAHLARAILRLVSLLLLLALIAIQLAIDDAVTDRLLIRGATLALAVALTASVVGDYVYGRSRYLAQVRSAKQEAEPDPRAQASRSVRS